MNSLHQAEIIAAILCLAVGVFVLLRQGRHAPKLLARVACPECNHVYGDDIFVSIVPVSYRWTVARGHTRASLKLPRTTHLVTCPHCLADFEFRADGSLFEHPQQGILSCVRTGRSRSFHAPVRRPKMNLAV